MVHQAEGCVFDLLRVSLYSHKCTVVRPRFAGGDPEDRTAEAGQWLDSYQVAGAGFTLGYV